MHSSTPTPDAAEALSQRLSSLIRAELAAAGWLSFARYMELALYTPGLGYYANARPKFGSTGDFVTAPELSPLFGQALARQVAQVLEMTSGDVLELGPGSGRLALALLRALQSMGRLPGCYLLHEASAHLREHQRALFAQQAPELLPRLHWVPAPPPRFSGLMLGNELLDALPVHRVRWGEAGPEELGVALDAHGRWVWQPRPITDPELLAAARAIDAPAGYESEIGLAARRLTADLAARLQRGVILFLDYGYPRREYYHPQRTQGTLTCHHRHHSHADPFDRPGLTDITAHVDFTAIAEAGHAAGLRLLGYIDQAGFLVNCGLPELLSRLAPDGADYVRAVCAAQKLLHPAEMGELIKVIALGRGVEGPLLGFARGDRSARL
ncbi:MAG: SAM-dependent methyltransferase [Sphingomonadaceae bacterium]|nr:SAM-dependent methyltransferase [Sphingomonadaceae bacterium]